MRTLQKSIKNIKFFNGSYLKDFFNLVQLLINVRILDGREKMVSTTFLNLKEEKKERVLNSALSEFSRAPINEASVTNIVKKAEISRGSFYQYFEDKEDLYEYLVKELYAKHRKKLYETIKLNSGNLYQSLHDFYLEYINEIMESDFFSFYEKTFIDMNHYLIGSKGLLSLSNQSPKKKNEQKDFVSLISTQNLKTDSTEDLLEFIYFTINLIHQMIVEGFINELSSEEIKEKALKAVNWLYYGIKDEN